MCRSKAASDVNEISHDIVYSDDDNSNLSCSTITMHGSRPNKSKNADSIFLRVDLTMLTSGL